MYVGTIRGGVYLFDGREFRHFTTRDGLSDNWVEWIFEDRGGNIWMAGATGLYRYDGTQLHRYFDGFAG